MENTTFTRITLTRDIDTVEGTKAINSGSYPAFIVNLSKSIQGVTVGDLAEAIERTETAAASAKESEINAKYSETSAKNSETNASESELAAKTSETNAKESETAAKSSENNAKDSETKAKSSETKAKTSETAAKTSENNANTSEINSKASEASASDSAAKAKVSETNSKLSEEEAKVAETGASSSASKAKTSETNAKASETNAKKSEDAAKVSETNAKASEVLVSDAYYDIIDKHSDVVTKAAEVEVARSEAVSSASTATSAATAASASAASASADAASAATSAINASASEIKAKEIVDGLIPLFDSKLDKTGGTITANSDALTLKNTSESQALFLGFQKSDGTRRGYIGSPSDADRIAIVNDIAATALVLTEDGRLTWKNRDLAALNRVTGEARAAPNWYAGQSGIGATFIKLCTVGTGDSSSQSQRFQIFVTNTSATGYSTSSTNSEAEQHFGIINLTIGNGQKPEKNILGSYFCSGHFDIGSTTIAPVLIKQVNAYKAEIWMRAGNYTNYTCLANTQGDIEISQHTYDATLVPINNGVQSSYYISNVRMFATANKYGNVEARDTMKVTASGNYPRVTLARADGTYVSLEADVPSNGNMANLIHRNQSNANIAVIAFPNRSGTAMLAGDFGVGGEAVQVPDGQSLFTFFGSSPSGYYRTGSNVSNKPSDYGWADFIWIKHSNGHGRLICLTNDNRTFEIRQSGGSFDAWKETMRVGDFGWGGRGEGVAQNWTTASVTEHFRANASTIWRTEATNDWTFRYCPNLMFKTGDTFANIGVDIYTGIVKTSAGITANTATYKSNLLWGTSNTTVDSSGNIKKASPVIKLFKDRLVPNDESEGVEMERLDTGVYLIKNILGLNSDPSWGGIQGGIVIPKGINDLNLVWLDYEVNPDGSMIIKTNYRKHSDLPPQIVKKRLDMYPEFVDAYGNELESYAPCDIPSGHWVDIRVQMPEDSIFNIRKREYEKAIEDNIINREREEALKGIVDEQNFWRNNEVQEIE